MWTLPNFAIAFFATAAVLLFNQSFDVKCSVGTAFSALAAVAWYAPHLDDIAASSGQGVEITSVGSRHLADRPHPRASAALV